MRVASEADHPQKLRAFLLGLFYSGEISAVLIVKLSLLITRAGGKGLEDLGRDIKHSKNSTRLMVMIMIMIMTLARRWPDAGRTLAER